MRMIEIDLEIHRLIETERMSFEETESEILLRLIAKASGDPNASAPSAQTLNQREIRPPIAIGSRTTGQWTVEAPGAIYHARNLKEAYATAVYAIAQLDPTFWERFAEEGNQRRRFVAKHPEALYPATPALAEVSRNNWHALDGWYLDLNISQEQAAKRVRRASALVGLTYGQDVSIKNAQQPI